MILYEIVKLIKKYDNIGIEVDITNSTGPYEFKTSKNSIRVNNFSEDKIDLFCKDMLLYISRYPYSIRNPIIFGKCLEQLKSRLYNSKNIDKFMDLSNYYKVDSDFIYVGDVDLNITIVYWNGEYYNISVRSQKELKLIYHLNDVKIQKTNQFNAVFASDGNHPHYNKTFHDICLESEMKKLSITYNNIQLLLNSFNFIHLNRSYGVEYNKTILLPHMIKT